MKLEVSGTKKDFKDNITINELLVIEEVESPEYVTVQVNGDFVDHKDFNNVLKDGDVIEFVYFMGGGAYVFN